MPMHTPTELGGIVTSVHSGSSASPTLTNITPAIASSTFPTAAGNSASDATASLTAPTNYVYVGCFEGEYIQPIIASYTVGSVDQCASFCQGSMYFQLEAGDECERLYILKTECNH